MFLGTFLYKWFRFFFPVRGWRKRYRAFSRGRNVWEVPGKPDKPKLIPFPLEWLPHRLDNLEGDDERKGFALVPAVCVDTGLEVQPGDGVLCLRCGVPLHPSVANIVTTQDPPYCRRCERFVV